jgi:hypothetical protein
MEDTFSNTHKQFVLWLIIGYTMRHIYLNIRQKFFLFFHLKNGGGSKYIPYKYICEKLKTVKDGHLVCWVTLYLVEYDTQIKW